MLTQTTWLISKMDPIKYIFETLTLTDRIACSQMLLPEYDIQYVIEKAIKGMVLVDQLAHQPIMDYLSLKFDFIDEDIMPIKDYEIPDPDEGPEPGERWTLIFNGASNVMGYGIGGKC